MFGGELKDSAAPEPCLGGQKKELGGRTKDLRGSETRKRAAGAVQRAEGPGAARGLEKRYRGSKKGVPFRLPQQNTLMLRDGTSCLLGRRPARPRGELPHSGARLAKGRSSRTSPRFPRAHPAAGCATCCPRFLALSSLSACERMACCDPHRPVERRSDLVTFGTPAPPAFATPPHARSVLRARNARLSGRRRRPRRAGAQASWRSAALSSSTPGFRSSDATLVSSIRRDSNPVNGAPGLGWRRKLARYPELARAERDSQQLVHSLVRLRGRRAIVLRSTAAQG